MCLLGIGFQCLSGGPLLVLANREEGYSRPATGPRIQPPYGGSPAWLGGIDLLAGGTWLGINAHGLLAAVTNRRRDVVPSQPRSRGMLCRSLLAFRSVAAASRSAVEQLRQEQFAGCNLLIATRDEAHVIEYGNEILVTSLTPGLHLITNAALDDSTDGRISRVRSELARAAPTDPTAWGNAARRICTLRGGASGPDIWLEGAERGTVSSTVVTLADHPEDSHFWHAPVPRAPVTYDDHAPLLHGLMAGSTAAAGRHLIHLRGPWRFEPMARVEYDLDKQARWTNVELPPHGTVRLPTPWSTFLPAFCGRVAFRRRFHRPNNLEPHERVSIVLDGVLGAGQVALNGYPLGSIDTATHTFCCDITEFLAGNDELLVELEVLSPFSDRGSCPPWQAASVEIRSDNNVVDS
jgi:Transport and Golgi organisation 2